MFLPPCAHPKAILGALYFRNAGIVSADVAPSELTRATRVMRI